MKSDRAFLNFVILVVAVALGSVIFLTNIISPDGKCLISYIMTGVAIVVGVYLHFRYMRS
jgi:hypothetical protein